MLAYSERGQFTYLERCAPQAPVVIGDARLKLAEARPGSFDILAVDAFSSDAIPLHLLTDEAAGVYDRPIPYLLTDLNAIIVNEMGKLDRAGDTLPFQRIKTKLDELRADPRYTFMFSGMLVSDSMGSFIAKLFRMPSQGRPISIVDVSGVPSEVT